ncbi:MAG: hypothetical protein Aurels2KO_56510 [Aureliella sp.]
MLASCDCGCSMDFTFNEEAPSLNSWNIRTNTRPVVTAEQASRIRKRAQKIYNAMRNREAE